MKIGGSANSAKKTTLISDFEDTFCELVDFEPSADHRFLQYFSVDYGL